MSSGSSFRPSPSRFLISSLLVLCLTLALVPMAGAQETVDLWRSSGLSEGLLASRAAVASTEVSITTSLLEEGAARLRLVLPDHREALTVIDAVERRGLGDLAWRGHLEGEPLSSVVLTLKHGLVMGRIQTAEAVYELRPTAEGRQILEKLDLSLFPACDGGVEPPQGATLALRETGFETSSATAADPVDRIDVMGVYTPQAEAGAGGQAQAELTLQAAVDNANTAFINSNMIARFNLVHTARVNRNDTGNLSSDLNWLVSSAEVATLRNQYAADMVGMLVNSGGGCGIGYVMRNPGPSFESTAFQVTVRSCAVGNLTYAHEHGHNMGFEHDPANGTSPSNASYPWSFGHYVNGSYRTVMSYSSPCAQGCTRVTQFSNPDINFNGVSTGIAEQRDNARSGDLTAPIVTDFRLAGSCGNGVIDGIEECDGSALGGASCSGNGCTGGTVSCTPACTLDFSACTGCSVCDNDGVCEVGEDCGNCANDCPSGSGASCGNGVCEIGNGEDCLSCAADCAGVQGGKPGNRYCCGDGAGTNPVDCADARCTSSGFQCSAGASGGWCCGDGICEGGESGLNCAIDCGAPPMCVPLGSPCATTGDCCTGKCKGAGGGAKTCQ